MTLIVYRDNVLVADTRVVVKKPKVGVFASVYPELKEPKHHVNADNTIAWIYDNDQAVIMTEPLCLVITLFELGGMKGEFLNIGEKTTEKFKALFLTRRNAYTVTGDGETFEIIIQRNLTYVSPDTSFEFYDCINLSAQEIFDCLAMNKQYHINNESIAFDRRSLTLISKRKKK